MGLIPENIKTAIAGLEPREELPAKELRPDGKYIVTITDYTPAMSTAGNPKVGLTLTFDEQDDRYWPTVKDANALVFTEKAAWKVEQVLTAFGLPLDVDGDGLLNAKAEIVLGRRTYTKKDGTVAEANQVSFYNPLPSATAASAATTPAPALF